MSLGHHHETPGTVRLQRFTRSFGGPNVLDGLVQIKRAIPTLALIPLAIIWLGIGEAMKIFLIFTAVLVPVYLNTHAALRGIDIGHVELAQTLGLSRAEFIRKVALPGALPGFFVGLQDKAGAWPATLSGGQKQRASLARSLLRDPHVLLADEPFGALDALTRMRMHGLLRRLVERIRPTVILVTHDVDESLLLADRILVLRDGRIAEDHAVALPHPRRPDHRDFMRLRTTLLRSLGVEAETA
jgi:sulfonate transport system ATP-binding protein